MVLQRIRQHVMVIKHNGIFDMQHLFHAMHDWFESSGYEFHERQAKHKVPSPAGSEEEYRWFAEMDITEYVKFTIAIFMHVWDLREIEVVKHGEKKTLTQGRILIEITPTLQLDWTERFGGSKFMQGLQDWFHKYIWKHEIEDLWWDELYYRSYKLHRVIKEALEFETKTNASEGRW